MELKIGFIGYNPFEWSMLNKQEVWGSQIIKKKWHSKYIQLYLLNELRLHKPTKTRWRFLGLKVMFPIINKSIFPIVWIKII